MSSITIKVIRSEALRQNLEDFGAFFSKFGLFKKPCVSNSETHVELTILEVLLSPQQRGDFANVFLKNARTVNKLTKSYFGSNLNVHQLSFKSLNEGYCSMTGATQPLVIGASEGNWEKVKTALNEMPTHFEMEGSSLSHWITLLLAINDKNHALACSCAETIIQMSLCRGLSFLTIQIIQELIDIGAFSDLVPWQIRQGETINVDGVDLYIKPFTVQFSEVHRHLIINNQHIGSFLPSSEEMKRTNQMVMNTAGIQHNGRTHHSYASYGIGTMTGATKNTIDAVVGLAAGAIISAKNMVGRGKWKLITSGGYSLGIKNVEAKKVFPVGSYGYMIFPNKEAANNGDKWKSSYLGYYLISNDSYTPNSSLKLTDELKKELLQERCKSLFAMNKPT